MFSVVTDTLCHQHLILTGSSCELWTGNGETKSRQYYDDSTATCSVWGPVRVLHLDSRRYWYMLPNA